MVKFNELAPRFGRAFLSCCKLKNECSLTQLGSELKGMQEVGRKAGRLKQRQAIGASRHKQAVTA